MITDSGLTGGPSQSDIVTRLLTLTSELPWSQTIKQLWVSGQKWLRRLTGEGMYEVLDYESTLELKDKNGQEAIYRKCEKVRYLQDNIIAYQDQAWGDGEILINYRCTPGVPVDQYRSGYKTHILISLREVKNRGNIDTFNIEWGINQGFLAKTGFWATEISHHTKNILVKVIFPKNRPPQSTSIVERNSQKTHILSQTAKTKLPDGRWLLSWEKKQPKLHEQYILKWEW